MSRVRGFGLALLFSLGCKPEPPTTPVGTTPAKVEGASEAARFWVAGDGLAAYDLDGERVATLGEIGDWARRLADGRFVVYIDGQQQNEIALLDADGELLRRVVLPLGFDPDTCAPTMSEGVDAMRPQDPRAFGVDLASGHACVLLQDRNDNMADFGLLVAVSLSDGTLTHQVSLDVNERCQDKGDIVANACADMPPGEPWIEGAPEPASPEAWRFDYDEATHTIVEGAAPHLRLCAEGADDESWGECAEIEATSPSGRWTLLSGRISEGDYIHRDLLLLDRSDAKLWQVVDEDQGARFVEATPAQVFAESELVVLSVVGESEIEWLPGDRLWVDGRLLIPDRRELVSIGGNLVYTR